MVERFTFKVGTAPVCCAALPSVRCGGYDDLRVCPCAPISLAIHPSIVEDIQVGASATTAAL